jgi:hypothetical protein
MFDEVELFGSAHDEHRPCEPKPWCLLLAGPDARRWLWMLLRSQLQLLRKVVLLRGSLLLR